MPTNPTITRFAPSPTGHLHIGGARTALFCWAYARRHHGRFLLRIEDTDQARSSEAAARGILADLAWLNIQWDEGPKFQPTASHDQVSTSHDRKGVVFGGDPRHIGPFYQSQRKEIYNTHFQRLLGSGDAYPAFDTPDQLAAMRKTAEAEKKTFIYRQAPDYNLDEALERAKTEPHVLRLKMPGVPITVEDQVLGSVTFPPQELDDFVIRKTDGFPTYHFAVVVDDAAMGVTHVLRGQEHLNNTPRHIALQQALALPTPAYAHMPLIFNADSTKMSKRDKDKAAKKAIRDAGIESIGTLVSTSPDHITTSPDRKGGVLQSISETDFTKWLKDKRRQLPREQLEAVAAAINLHLPEIDVEDFRAAGYLPEVLCNFLALLGWNPGLKNDDGTDLERFDSTFLAEHFETDRIGKTQSKFDRDKLLAFNADTIQHTLTDDEFAALWLDWAENFDEDLAAWAREDSTRWSIAAAAARPRTKTLRDARDAIAFAFIKTDTISYDENAVKKFIRKGEPTGLETLAKLRPVIAAIEPWTPQAIDATLAAFAETNTLGMGKVAQPLRIALTGTGVSPGLGHTLTLLTRETALARIDRALKNLVE
jgi:glutamyl/glutaminyl-tRNA synthetase